MTRQAARCHQHQVESQVKAGEIGSLEQKGFDGAGDPSPLARLERGRRGSELTPRLNLDDREHLTATRHDVDLARRAPPPARKDVPAPQSQMPETEPFRHPAAALRALAAKNSIPPDLPHSFSPRMARARR
jgi:hypothetical protein